MPTAWFRHSLLRTIALLGGLLLILSGCHHFHHQGGHGYRGGDHGGYHRGYDRGHRGDGGHRGGWRRGHGRGGYGRY